MLTWLIWIDSIIAIRALIGVFAAVGAALFLPYYLIVYLHAKSKGTLPDQIIKRKYLELEEECNKTLKDIEEHERKRDADRISELENELNEAYEKIHFGDS